MENNNLFQYATKELSQDAMLCWMINWINYEGAPLEQLGKDMLDLFLGQYKQERYFNVEVKRQYKKIDVLVLFNDNYALIIEDKTNTSEHGEQIAKYKELLQKEYPDRIIYTTYIKTGIIYDEDYMMMKKTNNVITIDDLLPVLLNVSGLDRSEILHDYVQYLSKISKERKEIDELIKQGKLSEAFKSFYGQFSFLNQVFSNRTKGTVLGEMYRDKDKNPIVYSDTIYAAANNDGSPWTQYCFWGKVYKEQLLDEKEIEYHYLFWRIDSKWCSEENREKYYIALRHYDKNTKKTDKTKARKLSVYRPLRDKCNEIQSANTDIIEELGIRENYQESDLLFIQIDKLERKYNNDFEKIANFLIEITKTIKNDVNALAEEV